MMMFLYEPGGEAGGGGGDEGAGQGSPPAAPSFDLSEGWVDHLPEEIRESKSLRSLPTKNGVAELSKMYVGLEKKFGKGRVSMPGEDATDEEIAEFHKQIGWPGDPGGYEPPEELKESLAEEDIGEWRKIANNAKLNKKQAAQVMQDFMEWRSQQAARADELVERNRNEAVELLKKEWGEAFDQNMEQASMAIKRFDKTGKLREFLNQTRLGDNPEMVKFAAQVGRMIAEDPIIGKGSGQSFIPGREEAKRQISQMSADPDFQRNLLNPHLPGHANARSEWDRLHKAAYSGKGS